MIANRDTQGKPIQPMGWPTYSYQNAAIQSRQDAERERRRVDQLTRRCRRLRAVAAWALTATITGMLAAFALGALFGYAIGAGLIGLVGR